MDSYIGEIRMFAGNFAPRDWALCNGQLVSVKQFTALFSILGTTYGGDGINNFALPDLRGRAPMHWGEGPNLTARALGQQVGSGSVNVSADQIPSHNHLAMAVDGSGTISGPADACWAKLVVNRENKNLYGDGSHLTLMSPQALGAAGGNQAHNNRQPYQGLNFIISLSGSYPVRPDGGE